MSCRSGAFRCPNITGSFGRLTSDNGNDPGYFKGAFEREGAMNLGNGGGATATNARNASFDASRSSGTYGDSSSVQPPSIRFLPVIKF